MTIPHWAPPTHAMQICRYAETGLDRAAVDLGDQPGRVAARVRARSAGSSAATSASWSCRTSSSPRPPSSPTWCCPPPGWGEKTGSFTNVDRTVHLSEKAVEPPGEARSDLDIFLDYADAMDFRDQDGEPADHVDGPGGGLRGVGARSPRRPCDYTGLSYDRLRGPTRHPVAGQRGAPRRHRPALRRRRLPHRHRLLRDLRPRPRHRGDRHRAGVPGDGARTGRAFLKAAPYTPPHEEPDRRVPAAAHDRPHRLPLPHPHQDRPAPRRSTTPRPTPGSSCPRPTPRRSASRRATWSGSSRRAARSRSGPGSAR